MATSFMDGSFLECPPRSPWAARRAETTVPPGCFASRSCVVRPPIQAPTDATSAHHESAGCASRSRRTTIYAARGRRSYHGGRDLGGRGRSAFPPPVAPQLRHEPRAPGRGHPCRPAPDGPFQHRGDHEIRASVRRRPPCRHRPGVPGELSPSTPLSPHLGVDAEVDVTQRLVRTDRSRRSERNSRRYVATSARLGLAQMRYSAQSAQAPLRRDHLMCRQQPRVLAHSMSRSRPSRGLQVERTLPSAMLNPSSILSLLPSA